MYPCTQPDSDSCAPLPIRKTHCYYISRGVFASINRMNLDSSDIISSNAWSGIAVVIVLVLMCRVEKRSECHNLSAFEEALEAQKQGDVSQLPSDTHDLHGVSRLALKNHLRGAGACSIFHSLCIFVLGMTGGASCQCYPPDIWQRACTTSAPVVCVAEARQMVCHPCDFDVVCRACYELQSDCS